MPSFSLVTGANGFLGARLVRLLVSRGEKVKAFVRAGANLAELSGLPREGFTLAYGDVTVEHTVYRALAGCDRLYHLAANHTHWDRQPERIATATVDGTRAVLGAAAKRRLAKIVVTSSWVTRGIHTEPVDETSEFNLRDTAPHIAAKLAAERAALKAADAGLPVVVVLPSFVVGPGDWKPTPSGALILEYLKTSPTFHFPVTTGGLSVADVDDIAAGHVAAMERGTVGERYLLGGENLNYESLFDTLSEVTGLPPPGRRLTPSALELRAVLMELRARWLGTVPLFTRSLARDLGHAQLYVNSAKAESELGYAHRPARTALARAARWYLDKGYVPERAARRIRLEPQLA